MAKISRHGKRMGSPPGPRPSMVKFPGKLAVYRLSWCRMRAQANYRGEVWDITWEEYQNLWEGRWHLRGTHKGSLGMSRRDWQGPWTLDNVEICLREQHWHRQRQAQIGRAHDRRKTGTDLPKNIQKPSKKDQ